MGADPLVIGIDGRELAGKPTGTGRYLRSLLRHWRQGPDRILVYFNGPAPHDPALAHPAIETRPIGRAPVRGLLWQQRLLPEQARADNLDVFFAPAYTCPLSLEVPRVTTAHDLSFFALPQDFSFLDALRRRWLVGHSLRASRLLLVCADFTRRELARLFPDLGPGVVRVIPHGPDDDLAPPPDRVQARARLSLGGPYLIAVGSVLNRRRAPELLRATALLRRRHPDLVLDVVGENRTQPRIDLARLVSALGLESNVRLSGYVDEAALADRYAAADLAVFLSDYEGFGMPALEAAARGVPLVVSDRPALGEVFAEAALLVDPRDETAIESAIDRALTEPGLTERLRVAGRALAGRHSWSETARRTREALLEAARR